MLLHVCLVIIFSMYVICHSGVYMYHMLQQCLCVSCYSGVCVLLQWCLDMSCLGTGWTCAIVFSQWLGDGQQRPSARHPLIQLSPLVLCCCGAGSLRFSPFLSQQLPTNVLEPSSSHRDSKCANDCRLYQSTRDADVPGAQQLVWMQVIVATTACRRLWLPWRGQRNHPARLSAPHFLNLDKLTSQASCRDSRPTRELVCHHVHATWLFCCSCVWQ